METSYVPVSCPCGDSTATTAQYVWSPAYLDAMVERDRDTDANGTLDERLYAQTDANYNVTSLVDTSGAVVERYVYDPYGNVTVLKADGTLRGDGTASASSYASVYLHQGGRLDTISGLYYFRNRDYSPTMGRWMGEDPAGYVDGASLYGYVADAPTRAFDPSGLRRIEFAFVAFIDVRLGRWLAEPGTSLWTLLGRHYYFRTDLRSAGRFGVQKRNGRVFSYGWIDSQFIGQVGDKTKAANWDIKTDTGDSHEMIAEAGQFQRFTKKATPEDTTSANSFLGCSEVGVRAWASYPFSIFAPDIDYRVSFEFVPDAKDNAKIDVAISGTHDEFPDYEAYLDGKLVYLYRTKDTGPSLSNLGGNMAVEFAKEQVIDA